MTTAILDRADGPSLSAGAPVGPVSPPTGVDLPDDFDASRVYLPAPAVYIETPYEFPAGPPSPNPNRVTLAMVVQGLNP